MTSDLQAQQAALQRRQRGGRGAAASSSRPCCRASAPASSAWTAKGRISAINRQAPPAAGDPANRESWARPLARSRPSSAIWSPGAEAARCRGGDRRHPRRRDPAPAGARRGRSGRRHGADLRRHHPAGRGPAQRRLARRGPPHRPRDQEPADADPAVGRAAAPQVPRARSPTMLETFDRCTDTIIRQVGDIGRMVDEFSSFARMPAPQFAPADAAELLRAGGVRPAGRRARDRGRAGRAAPDGRPQLRRPHGRPGPDQCAQERRRGRRRRAAPRRRKAEGPDHRAGWWSRTAGVAFEIEDNGVGLPAKDRDRLTEPYVTTREKGTGLGLAIVKRILEDHGGELELADARERAGRALGDPALPAAPARVATRQPRATIERRHEDDTMAADVLVVDDEADIRELVAGILEDEGYAVRTATNSEERPGRHPGPQARAAGPRHLDAGRRHGRAGAARPGQGAGRRPAGGHDLRPRQHRDRRQRHQARRLRLPGEAVQVRPPAAGGRARAGGRQPASARTAACAPRPSRPTA